MRLGGTALVIAAIVAIASAARAAEPTPEDKALATTLFKEAKAAIDAGRVAEACRKFEESQRLDPGGGTLLNLAVCHEREGRTASAYAEFTEALAIARRDANPARIDLAQARLAALEPHLARLRLVAPEATRAALTVVRDGSPLGAAAWETAMPVDPGPHTIEASAPGKTTWRTTVDVAADETKTIEVPALADAPSPPPQTPPPAPTPTPTPTPTPSPLPPPPPSSSPLRTAGFVTGASGLAVLGFGAFAALHAKSLRSDSDALCPADRCTTAGVAANDSAKSWADVATVTMALGAAALATGAVLVITGGPRVSASVGPGHASLDVRFVY